ncbi:MAG: sugar epimerase, partial [Rhodobacteraceae bacterium]|nr:sugar epimerase [Paracoccaceae bacterium]
FAELIALAADLGFAGVELRNDLPQALFDGVSPEDAGQMMRDRGLHLFALAEVKRFNDWSSDKAREAHELMTIARAAGAHAVSLIPRNDGLGLGNGERQAALRVALKALRPMLEDHDLVGMVEPLGFEICALRHKMEAVEVIEGIGASDRFKLVHDTFHHTLAQGGPFYPAHTGIVHISGVTDPNPTLGQMTDAHRGLVDASDRLGNLDQIATLMAHGFTGPVSFEAFAPEVHVLADPKAALIESMQFIRDGLAARAA